MTEYLKKLYDLIWGGEGYTVHDSDPWEDVWEFMIHDNPLPINEWEIDINRSILTSSNTNYFIINFIKILDDEYINKCVLGKRYTYYSNQIDCEVYKILKAISKSYRNGEKVPLDQLLIELRWCVFELTTLSHKYIYAFQETIGEFSGTSDYPDCLNSCNYVINIYAKIKAIELHDYISRIQDPYCIEKNYFLESTTYNSISIQNDFYTFLNSYSAVIERGAMLPMYNFLCESYIRLCGKYANKLYLDKIINLENKIYFKYIAKQRHNDNSESHSSSEVEGAKSNEQEKKQIENIATIDSKEIIKSELEFYLEEISVIDDRYERISAIESIITKCAQYLNFNKIFESIELVSIPRAIINKLNTHKAILSANPSLTSAELEKINLKPITLNMSVSELAVLLRLLEKTKLIDLDTKSQIFKTISSIVITKGLQGKKMSQDSFKVNYYSPEESSYSFWNTQLSKFRELLKDTNKLISKS